MSRERSHTRRACFALAAAVAGADHLRHIRKDDVRAGDLVLVKTSNSLYALRALGNDLFHVSGGWFDRTGRGPRSVRVNGCTWGSAIHAGMLAACGLRLEFSNRLVTSTIRAVAHLPTGTLN